jgi:hypothetical protein
MKLWQHENKCVRFIGGRSQITAWLLLLRRYFSQVLFAHYWGVIGIRNFI